MQRLIDRVFSISFRIELGSLQIIKKMSICTTVKFIVCVCFYFYFLDSFYEVFSILVPLCKTVN